MERESVVMPVKQQYLIALALIALVAVMVVFAMFDYFSDKARYAETLAGCPRAMGAPAMGLPQSVGAANLNANVPGTVQCFTCGWQGQCMVNGRCPNCYAAMGAMGTNMAGAGGPGTQNANFFGGNDLRGYRCFGCGWRGQCMAGGRCPNCLRAMAPIGNAWGGPGGDGAGAVGGVGVGAQNAHFLWFQPQPQTEPQPQPTSVSPPKRMLYCPKCEFLMNVNSAAIPSGVRCPRCPATLVSTGQPGTEPGAGQQAGWWPNCPIDQAPLPYYSPVRQGAALAAGTAQPLYNCPVR